MRQYVIIPPRIEYALSLHLIESTNLLSNHFKTKANLNKFTLRHKLSLTLIWSPDIKMVDCSLHLKQVIQAAKFTQTTKTKKSNLNMTDVWSTECIKVGVFTVVVLSFNQN